MENFLMSAISIPDLVNLIVIKVEERIIAASRKEVIQPVPETRLYGDREAAAYIGCTVQTIGRLRKDREIPFHRYGRKYYYFGSEIDTALKVDARRFGELRRKK